MSRCTPDNDLAQSESASGVQGHYTLGFDSDTVRWSDLIEDPSTDHLLRFRVASNAEIAYIAYSQRRRRFAPFCVAGVSAVAYFVMWLVDSFHLSRIPLFVLAGLLLPVISLLVTWPQVYCYRKLARLVKLPEAVVFARVAEGVSVLTAIVGTVGGVITWRYVQTTHCAEKEPEEDAIMCQRVLSEAYVSVAVYVMRPRFCIALPILALQFAASCTAQFGMKRVDDVTSLLQEVVHLALVIIAAVVLGFDERSDRQRFVGLAHVRQARREVKARQAALDALTSALPPWALHRLRTAPSLDAAMALEFAQAAVVGGCDIVDFSRWSTGLLPAHVVLVLHRLFTALDAASRSHGVVKVATYADSYTVLLGMHDLVHAHATTTNPLNSASAANGGDDALDGAAPGGLEMETEQREHSAPGPGYRQATVRRNQRTMRRFIRWCVRSAVRSSGLVFERAVSTPRSGHSTPLLQQASGGSASSVERTVGLVFGDPTGGSGGGRGGALSGAFAAAFASDSGSGADDRGDLFAEQPGSNVVSLRGAVVTGPVVGSIAGSASSLKYIIAGAAIDALRGALRESSTGVREVSLLPEMDDTYEIDDEDDAADELYFRLAAVANAADIPAPHDLHDPVHLPDAKSTGRGSSGRGKWGFEVLVWGDDDDDLSQPACPSSGNADGANGSNANGNFHGNEENQGFADVRFAPAGQSSAATAVIKRYAMNPWSVRFNDPLIERYAGAFVAASDAAATPVVSACVGGLFCVGVVISFVQWLLPTDQLAHDTSGVDPGGLALLSTAAVGLIGRALLFAAAPTLFTAPESIDTTPAPAAPQTASGQGDQSHNFEQRSDETFNDAEQLAAANDIDARNSDDEDGVDSGGSSPSPPSVLFPVTWRVWVDHGLTFAFVFCAARSMWFFDDTVFSASPQMIFWLLSLLPSLFQQTAYWPVRATMQLLVGQVAFMLIRFWNLHDFGWDVPYNPLSLAIAAVVGVVLQYLASRSTKDSYAAGALVTELTTIAKNDADLESTLLHTLLPAHAAMIANDMTHAVSYQRLLAADDATRLGYAPHAESQWHGLVVLCGRFAPPPGHSTGNGAAFSQWCVESSWRWSLLVAAINAVCPNSELEIVEGFGDAFVIAGPFERRAEADGRGAVASSHAARRLRRTSLDSLFTSSQHPSSQKGKRASDPQSTPCPASRVTNPRLRSNPTASIQSSTMMSQPQPAEQLAASPVDPASAGSPQSTTTATNSNQPASTRGQTHTNNHQDEREPNVRSASAAHRAFGSVRSVSDHFTAAFTTETEGAPLVATASATSVSAVASIHLLRSLLHAFSDRGGVQAGLSVGLASSALLGGRLLSYRLFGPAVREASAVLEAGSMPHGTVWYTTPAFRRAYRAAFAHTARPDHVPVHQFRGDQPDMSRAYGRSEMDIVPPPSQEPPPHSGYQHQPRHRRHPLPIADDVAPEGDATFGPLMRWRLRAAGVLMVSRVKD